MRLHLLVLTAAATIAVAACGGGGASPTPEPSPAAPDPTLPAAGMTGGGLAGTSWIGVTADPASPADPARISISFDDATLSATGGCNSMGGSYSVVDGVLSVGPMVTTEMACEEPLMAQDQWLSTLLNGAKVVIDGATLTLVNNDTSLTLVDEQTAKPDGSIEDTLWMLDGISGGGTTSSVPAGVTASILIQDGVADVRFGCNTGGGSVGVGDATLTFGPLAMTMMLCEGPGGEVETAMSGVLQGEVPYTIDGSVLTLSGANGTTLSFVAAEG